MMRGASGLLQSAAQSKLFELRGANLNTTADQAMQKVGTFTRFQITNIVSVGRGGNAGLAAGGIYNAPAKGGNAIVSAAQAWGALSAIDKVLTPALIALGDVQQASPWLSLTTAAGAAATADLFVYGVVMD